MASTLVQVSDEHGNVLPGYASKDLVVAAAKAGLRPVLAYYYAPRQEWEHAYFESERQRQDVLPVLVDTIQRGSYALAELSGYGENAESYLAVIDPEGREIALVNPLDVDTYVNDHAGRHRGGESGLWVLWFGQHASSYLAVFARGLEDALEEAAGWLADFAPGHFVSDEEMHERQVDARKDLGEDATDEAVWEAAEADMTYTESGWIHSYEWGYFYDPTSAPKEIIALAADLYEEEYDERPEGL